MEAGHEVRTLPCMWLGFRKMDRFFFGAAEIGILSIVKPNYMIYPISHHGKSGKSSWLKSAGDGRDMLVLWRVVKEPASFKSAGDGRGYVSFVEGSEKTSIFTHLRPHLRRFSVGSWVDGYGFGWPFYHETFREDRRLRSSIKILWHAIDPGMVPCRWGTSFTASVSTSGFEHLNEDPFVPSTRLGCVTVSCIEFSQDLWHWKKKTSTFLNSVPGDQEEVQVDWDKAILGSYLKNLQLSIGQLHHGPERFPVLYFPLIMSACTSRVIFSSMLF